MSKIIVKSSHPLNGTVRTCGAKNAALPILAATLLTDGQSELSEMPLLSDIENMRELMRFMGCVTTISDNDTIIVNSGRLTLSAAPYELVSKLRASFLVMGPMLARFGEARISLPGGCPIGSRPVDLHLKGFKALGAKIIQGHGYIEARARRLQGAKIYLDFPSVGATENILMAATLAKGQTVIENAAVEPEIVDLTNFLNAMGADIKGAGTDTIRITGVKSLNPVDHAVIPDRIEAGTYMIAAAITKGNVKVENVVPSHLKPITAKLREIGASVEEGDNYISVTGREKLRRADIKTLPFPGFPTDMQAQFSSLMSIAEGTSLIIETIFENRFMHIGELKRMGADIKIEGRSAVIEGGHKLTGAQVQATDLRAGAALVLAGLVAEGCTEISGVEHINRGYCGFVNKLKDLGADIEICD